MCNNLSPLLPSPSLPPLPLSPLPPLPLSPLQVLIPSWTIRRLKLWNNYFLAWDGTLSVVVDPDNVTQETADSAISMVL